MIGTTLALIMAGTAAAQAGMGAKAAHDSKKASQQQVQASDRALAFRGQQYQQSRQDLAPWQATGYAAMNQLNARSGLPTQPAAPTGSSSLASFAPMPGATPHDMMATSTAGTPAPGGAAPMVTLKAPNGMTKQVPASMADHYVSRGATRV